MISKQTWIFLLIALVAIGGFANDDALTLITRKSDDDRNRLLEARVPLVEELNDGFLALGNEKTTVKIAERLGFEISVIDHSDGHSQYATAALIHQERAADLESCGEVISFGEGWHLLKASAFDSPACTQSTSFMLRVLPLRILKPSLPPPDRYEDLQSGGRVPTVADPLIQDMVNNLTDDVAMAHWQAIMDSAATRYSQAQGCIDAAEDVYNLFDGYGLAPAYHNYSASYPDNVVGTLTGTVTPSEVVVVLGHLDSITYDTPMSLAPGADDNASGSAMVTALAEAMSCYEFEKTIKFLTVTGEEQGLYGSSGWADDANSTGVNIVAALNGDMIAWEGDGIPATGETLDVHTNSASAWLGNLMAQQSSTYETGVPVNAFLCPGMTSSDHAPFWSHGWSAICGITDSMGWGGCPDADEGFNPYYHSNDDTIANSGPGAKAFLGGNARTYIATAADIAVPIAAKTSTPTSLTAQGDGIHRIALAWASSGSGYLHQVYRAPGGCSNPGPAVLLNTTATTNFTDTTASGQITYGYWINSVDGHCSSIPTSCVEATTTGTCNEPPVFSGLETVTNQAAAGCALELTWATSPTLYCGSTADYSIYRSTDSGFSPSPANRIAENIGGGSFLDTEALISGQKYYYIVRAVDGSNDVEDNNLKRISGTATGPSTMGIWTDDAGDTGDASMSLQAPWTIRTDSTHSGSNAYGTGNYGNNTCSGLTTPTLHLHTGSQLNFWSSYQIEADYDKGVVQISTDLGNTWVKVPVNYPDDAIYSSDQCGLPSGDFFSNDSLVGWTQYSASLASWAGEDVLIRWQISSDGGLTEDGWWIDDIEITNVGVPGDCTTVDGSNIFIDGFESGNPGDWSFTQP